MDASCFDRLTRSLATASSRRLLLRGLATFGLAAGFVPDIASVKKRKKKLKLNAYGCVNVGGKCRGKDSVCCSGLCQGKKPKKGKQDKSKCVAHNVLDCPAGADSCLAGVTCGTNDSGVCFQTTGKASFCGDGFIYCAACTKDVECEPLGGPGAACITCPGSCQATGNTFCIAAAN